MLLAESASGQLQNTMSSDMVASEWIVRRRY